MKYDIFITDVTGQLRCIAVYCPEDVVVHVIQSLKNVILKEHKEKE